MSSEKPDLSSIRGLLLRGFFVIIIFTLGYFALSYYYVDQSESQVEQAINKHFNTSLFISKLAIDGQKLRRYEKEYFIYADNPEKRSKYSREWTEAKDDIKQRLQKALNNPTAWSVDNIVIFEDWMESLNNYAEGFENVVYQVDNGQITTTIEANHAIHDAKNAFRTFLSGTNKVGEDEYKAAQGTQSVIKTNFNHIYMAMAITAITGFILLIVIHKRVASSIENPIRKLTASADAMSKGNLDVQVDNIGFEEFYTLTETLDRLRISQRTMLNKLLKK